MSTTALHRTRSSAVGLPPAPRKLPEQPDTRPSTREVLTGSAAYSPGSAVPELMTIQDVCREASLGRTTVYQEIQGGGLAAYKIGRRTVIKRSDFAAWIASLKPAVLMGSSVTALAAVQEGRGAGRAA